MQTRRVAWGKTTTAINLATALAAIGERVLIVDLDPQGNASTGLGIDRRNRELSSYDLLIGSHGVAETVLPTAVPNLAIIPSTMDLLGIEMEIAQQNDRVFPAAAGRWHRRRRCLTLTCWSIAPPLSIS